MLHDSNLCYSTCGMKEVLLRRNTLHIVWKRKASLIFRDFHRISNRTLGPTGSCISLTIQMLDRRVLYASFIGLHWSLQAFIGLHLHLSSMIFTGLYRSSLGLPKGASRTYTKFKLSCPIWREEAAIM